MVSQVSHGRDLNCCSTHHTREVDKSQGLGHSASRDKARLGSADQSIRSIASPGDHDVKQLRVCSTTVKLQRFQWSCSSSGVFW